MVLITLLRVLFLVISEEFNKPLILKLTGMKVKPTIQLKTRYLYNPELSSPWFIVPGPSRCGDRYPFNFAYSLNSRYESGKMGQWSFFFRRQFKPLEIIIGKLIPYTVIGLAAVLLVVNGRSFWFWFTICWKYFFIRHRQSHFSYSLPGPRHAHLGFDPHSATFHASCHDHRTATLFVIVWIYFSLREHAKVFSKLHLNLAFKMVYDN
jgi:hypothetical protein